MDGLTELFSGSGGHDNAGEGKDEEAPNKVDALYSASSPSSATSPAASSKTLSSTAIATARAPPQSSLPLRNHPEKEERFKARLLQLPMNYEATKLTWSREKAFNHLYHQPHQKPLSERHLNTKDLLQPTNLLLLRSTISKKSYRKQSPPWPNLAPFSSSSTVRISS